MIIAEALDRLIEGTSVDITVYNRQGVASPKTTTIQFHYGDNRELNKWIKERGKFNIKYPLVWYVINPYRETLDGYKSVETQLIIFNDTDLEFLNDIKALRIYEGIIEPTWQKVKKLLERNKYISVMGSYPDKYIIKDEPASRLMGVATSRPNPNNKDYAEAIDLLDKRVIELKLRIKTDCI
mgnify:CR=1 FL=1